MKITIVCSDPTHPIQPHLRAWCEDRRSRHDAELVTDIASAKGGDVLFLVSCAQIVSKAVRQTYRVALVLHASDLPEGRGWSPLVWQILEGRREIVVSLIEAEDPVDSGPIWAKRKLALSGTELCDEINEALFDAEIALMDFAVENFGAVVPQPQGVYGASWYPRRKPEDSRLDPDRTLAEQFDLLRVADPDRYPAFFDHRGERYVVTIRKQARDD